MALVPKEFEKEIIEDVEAATDRGGLLIPPELTEEFLSLLRETQPIRFGPLKPLGLSSQPFPLDMVECSFVSIPLKSEFKVRHYWWGRRAYDRVRWWLMRRRFRLAIERASERLKLEIDNSLWEKMNMKG